MAEAAHRSDRDWDRADAWLGLTSFALIMVMARLSSAFFTLRGPLEAFMLLAYVSHPYLSVRIIRHFRAVPRWWSRTSLALAIVGTLAALVLPSPKPIWLRAGVVVYVGLSLAVAAIVLALTARQHRGLTAWRLNFAAVGATLFAAIFTMVVLSSNSETYRFFVGQLWLMRLLPIAMVVSYTLGLVPPRFVRRLLQRGVEYRFLRRANERRPDERARLVPIDLAHAAVRSTATAATIVLTGTGPMRIDGASDPAWRGLLVDSPGDAIGRALASGAVATGDVSDLAPMLQRLAGTADRFLAVPITGRTRVWGLLLIVQRRRSLFPKDDVAILERLCRYTADILDHAQLITDERARQQREADAHLDLILESLQDYAVITVDDAGVITSWNVGAEHLFLYSRSESIGAPVHRLFADDAPWLMDQMRQVRGGGAPEIPDTIGRRKDDSRLTTTVVIRPLQTRGRQPGGFVMVMRDVSQRRVLEDRLRQAQKLEAIGRLAGGVAHDFNNMLTVILGYASNLDDVVAAEHRGSLAEIRKAAERAASLTRQLLAFSRQQAIRPRVVALRDTVAEVLPMLARLLGEHIEIVQEVDLNVPSILADPAQLEQVVVNLSVNARDAMPTEGRLTIRVRSVTLSTDDAKMLTGRAGLHAVLEVTDTGSGVSQATQARMFEPFFTTKEVGHGTGLGLAMVYGTVQQMNGAITFESELGRGTTFRIFVPAHVAD